jgi:5-methylcytosine-specific restriction endonuclease McrA
MRNLIKNLPKEQLQEILTASTSLADTLFKLELPPCGSHYASLNARIKQDGLSVCHFTNKRFTAKALEKNTAPLDDILVEKSRYKSRASLKKRLVREGRLQYQCAKCGNQGTWQNKKLSLQLDHINGIRNDNRLTNLRFLCPNCHSQTETFSGKWCKGRDSNP